MAPLLLREPQDEREGVWFGGGDAPAGASLREARGDYRLPLEAERAAGAAAGAAGATGGGGVGVAAGGAGGLEEVDGGEEGALAAAAGAGAHLGGER